MAQEPRPTIWYSPSTKRLWMAPDVPLEAATLVLQYEDAIQVTNAYDVLPPHVIADLRREAHRD